MTTHASHAAQPTAESGPHYSMRLQNKVAIVTGGGTGIGRAITVAFARQGARVAICGRRKEKLDEALALAGDHAAGLAIQADVTRKEDTERLVQETIGQFKKIDILVNCAGAFKGDTGVHQTSDEDWKNILDINLDAVFRLTRAALPHMIQNKSGSIINVASILGMIATPNASAYNVSKGGLIQFTRSLAAEYGKDGIRANTIAPGLVKTPMTDDFMNQKEFMDQLIKQYPIGCFGEPDDIAHAAVYLASNEAKWVTGVLLPVDGGYTAL